MFVIILLWVVGEGRVVRESRWIRLSHKAGPENSKALTPHLDLIKG